MGVAAKALVGYRGFSLRNLSRVNIGTCTPKSSVRRVFLNRAVMLKFLVPAQGKPAGANLQTCSVT